MPAKTPADSKLRKLGHSQIQKGPQRVKRGQYPLKSWERSAKRERKRIAEGRHQFWIVGGEPVSQITFSVTHGWSAFGGADHGWQDVGLERRARTLAQAVCGSVGSQSTATNVPALRVGTDRSWRPQERSADGEAACARRMRSIASLHCGRGLGRNACGNRTPCPSRQAGRRQRCRAGDRRYCDTQERHAFGWCRCAICVSAGQDRELPDPGIADAGARRSAGRTGVAVVSSRELDEQAVSVGASGCSGRMSNGTNETGNGSGGDRSCHRGRCALWLRVGGCRLWTERAVPSGAHSSQTCLGSRYSAAPQGVPCRCEDDLASCKAWSSPSAARS